MQKIIRRRHLAAVKGNKGSRGDDLRCLSYFLARCQALWSTSQSSYFEKDKEVVQWKQVNACGRYGGHVCLHKAHYLKPKCFNNSASVQLHMWMVIYAPKRAHSSHVALIKVSDSLSLSLSLRYRSNCEFKTQSRCKHKRHSHTQTDTSTEPSTSWCHPLT